MSKKIIFENEFVEALVISWKRNRDFNTYKRICAESINLLDSIIRGSKFNLQVPFLDLRNWLFIQFERWITRWIPGEGKLYTYMSVSCKHACMSYVTKEKLLRQRYVYTDVPLEALSDAVAYSENFGFDTGERMKQQLADIVVRWHEPVVREAIKYMMYAVLRNRGVSRRKFILKTACEAYRIDLDTAKFMLDWTHGAVRHAFLEHYDHPLTYQDLLTASSKFSFLRDLMNVIGFEQTKKLCCIFAGTAIKFPPASQLVKYARIAAAVKDSADDEAMKRHNMDREQLYTMIEGILGPAGDGILEERPLYSGVHEVPAIH